MNPIHRFKCLVEKYKITYNMLNTLRGFQTREEIYKFPLYFQTEDIFHKIVNLYSQELEHTGYDIEAKILIDELVDVWMKDEYLDALSGIICLYNGIKYDNINIKIQDILLKRNIL